MTIHKLRTALFTCVIFLTSLVHSKVIIWDLGKTLVDTSRWSMATSELGLRDIIGCLPKVSGLENLLFDTLNLLTGKQITSTSHTCNHNGKAMSQGMCNWLAGLQTPQELLNIIDTHIPRLVTEKYFYNTCEQRLLTNSLHAMLDPITLVKHTFPIKEGVKLLKACSKAGHRNMILSNWDPASFQLLYLSEKTATIFDEIAPEDLIISGFIGLLKPHPSIFEYAMAHGKLTASECIFIDDQIENINAARACGMHAIHLKKGNYQEIYRELKKLGVDL